MRKYCSDTFVNTNAPVSKVFCEDEVRAAFEAADNSGVENADMAVYDKYEALFLEGIKYDNVNSEGDPVLIYELEGKPVAWYDLEMFRGFIA